MGQHEKTFRQGSCNASIVKSIHVSGERSFTLRKVVFQRHYRDNDGNWKSTHDLRVNDIPKAVIVLNRAYEFLTSNGGPEDDSEA